MLTYLAAASRSCSLFLFFWFLLDKTSTKPSVVTLTKLGGVEMILDVISCLSAFEVFEDVLLFLPLVLLLFKVDSSLGVGEADLRI